MYQILEGVKVWGTPDPGALAQAVTCSQTGNVAATLLMADHHKGYSQPIRVCMAGGDEFDPYKD